MLKKAVLVLAVLLVALVVLVSTRPSSFRIERTAQVAAPAPIVFAMVNDFHQWPNWSPWEKLDAGMKKTYAGAAAGAGAVYEWSGNDKVGEGRMTILESRPNEVVKIKLEFIKPWTATNTAIFTLTPSGDGTQVSWAMEGQNNFMAKAFTMFMDMDKMVGKDFERGLSALKEQSEAEAKKRAAAAAQAAAAQAAAAQAATSTPPAKTP